MPRKNGDSRSHLGPSNRAGQQGATRRLARPGAPSFKIPIALKFTLPIALLTLASMTWVTYEADSIAQQTHDEGVNRQGLLALILFTSELSPDWLSKAELQERVQDATRKAYVECQERGVSDIIDILVSDREEFVLARGSGAKKIWVTADRERIEYDPAREAGVEIYEFNYRSPTHGDQPIRSFERLITVPTDNEDGTTPGKERVLGKAQLLLSATRIQLARDRVRTEMIRLSVLAALASAVASFVVATILTRPIRSLRRDIRQVSLGNLDHKSSLNSPDELGELARTFNQMTDNLREAQDVLVAQRATEHELNLATRIQRKLLPSTLPRLGGFDVSAFYQSAKEVGGDYYDFLRVGRNQLGMVVADVSGKGIPGSLVMTMTRSLLRLATRANECPSETVRIVNRALSPDMSPGMFVTLLYFTLHVPTRTIRLIRAGHNGPILYSSRTRRVSQLNPRGIALGLDPQGNLFDAELELAEFRLQSGDVFVAFTDGVTEAKDDEGHDYSDARLTRIVKENAAGTAAEIQNAILADMDAHRGRAEQSDDVTLLVLKFDGE